MVSSPLGMYLTEAHQTVRKVPQCRKWFLAALGLTIFWQVSQNGVLLLSVKNRGVLALRSHAFGELRCKFPTPPLQQSPLMCAQSCQALTHVFGFFSAHLAQGCYLSLGQMDHHARA